MEAQSTYAKETKSKDNLFKQLLLVQITLEKFRNDHLIYFEQVENIIQSIDELFESVIKDGWEPNS